MKPPWFCFMIALYLADGQQRQAESYMMELMAACAFNERPLLARDVS